jgi:hypothetical protein
MSKLQESIYMMIYGSTPGAEAMATGKNNEKTRKTIEIHKTGGT